MGKYEPLGDFLREQRTDEVPMSFADIERVTGVRLPPKAQQHRAWWSNNPSNNVMTKVWLDAGYQTERVDIEARKLVFRRMRATVSQTAKAVPPTQALPKSKRHPLFGALKGLIRVVTGTDLTKPSDPEWGAKS